MDSPIAEFISNYCHSSPVRLHMPGHKGMPLMGVEHMDITEIPGADSLYQAEGIIRSSEENASQLFGCPTYYSTEGSSQCIRAMLHLIQLHGGAHTRIIAARNVHKSFLNGVALLDIPVQWVYPSEQGSYLSCALDYEVLEELLVREKPTAFYVTSPDYLGNMADIPRLAQICHRNGVLLVVDNAHGAYLRFVTPSLHPMSLGADLCCASAHKTLPVLTGGAYLHISENAPGILRNQVRNALALFGSTSPSYLILQSLDLANAYLLGGYRYRLKETMRRVQEMKQRLADYGYGLIGDEPVKITLCPKPLGYTGQELDHLLREQSIYCEYADPDYVVLMVSPELGSTQLKMVEEFLLSIPPLEPLTDQPPPVHPCEAEMSIREAILSPSHSIPADHALGMILAAPSVGCPPAVPIVICGERIDLAAIQCFRYYGISHISVVTNWYRAGMHPDNLTPRFYGLPKREPVRPRKPL